MFKTFVFMVLAIASTHVVYAQQNNLIDLDAVDWQSVCSNLQPMELHTEVISCPVSHPASRFHRYAVINLFALSHPEIELTCDYFVKEIEHFNTPTHDGDQYSLCKKLLKSAYLQRVRHPEEFYDSLEDWTRHVFGY